MEQTKLETKLIHRLCDLLNAINRDDDGDYFICNESSHLLEAARKELAPFDNTITPFQSVLTDAQINRQDFVDNEIFALLKKLNPEDKFVDIEYDIDIVGKVREVIQQVFVEDLELSTEMDFYPYVK